MILLGAFEATALIFASPDFEPSDAVPPDFPYWEHVAQRRYEGPTVIYLGAGWALTARHVGMGEIILGGEIILPNFRSPHTLMNVDGSPADIMVFQLAAEANLPDLPLLPLASEPPRPGENVIVIGFGRGRGKVIEWNEGGGSRFGFTWNSSGAKRWGTNQIVSNDDIVVHSKRATRALTFAFDPPNSRESTRFEVQAATGDSGGAVFVERDGGWELAGMMVSVVSGHVSNNEMALYGDLTYAADISFYRSEIYRWARPTCANGLDDDGDEKIDFPLDPDCTHPADSDERRSALVSTPATWVVGLAGIGIVVMLIYQSRQRN